MPTSPRDLAGGTGWYQPTALLSNPRADVGIGPYAYGRFLPLNLVHPMFLGVPSTPVPGCARSTLGKHRGPPHTRQGFALPPSPKRGFFPLVFFHRLW